VWDEQSLLAITQHPLCYRFYLIRVNQGRFDTQPASIIHATKSRQALAIRRYAMTYLFRINEVRQFQSPIGPSASGRVRGP
jgi:hypothetical protein